jgi:hypothetical protein
MAGGNDFDELLAERKERRLRPSLYCYRISAIYNPILLFAAGRF